MAYRRHGTSGKTEMWYTLSAADDACIYSGLQRSVTPEALREHIANGSVMSLLAKFRPVPGDYFYLPGRPHTLARPLYGAGDTTAVRHHLPHLRLQPPGLDGKPRSLHIDGLLKPPTSACTKTTAATANPFRPRAGTPGVPALHCHCSKLRQCTRIHSRGPLHLPAYWWQPPGEGRVTDDLGNTVHLRGDTP